MDLIIYLHEFTGKFIRIKGRLYLLLQLSFDTTQERAFFVKSLEKLVKLDTVTEGLNLRWCFVSPIGRSIRLLCSDDGRSQGQIMRLPRLRYRTTRRLRFALGHANRLFNFFLHNLVEFKIASVNQILARNVRFVVV